jgi:formylglycine-generating enzyme required for sulfatase activity
MYHRAWSFAFPLFLLLSFVQADAGLPVGQSGFSGENGAPKKQNPRLQFLEVELAKNMKVKFARLEPAKFGMGSSAEEQKYLRNFLGEWASVLDAETQHDVEITTPYYIGVYEITQQEYATVMEKNPSSFSPNGFESHKIAKLDTSRFPVEGVTWDEAVEFCKRASARSVKRIDLPTEAEWEYACRAGTKGPFSFGNSLSCQQANIHSAEPYVPEVAALEPLNRPAVVGSYEPNAFGLHDMHGNVAEWCKDLIGEYGRAPVKDPQGPAPDPQLKDHVVRGGSFANPAWTCRCASRLPADERVWRAVGFRVVFRPN